MKNKFIHTLLVLLSFLTSSLAQDLRLEDKKYTWLDFDNDLFFKTDRYYTNGLTIGFIHPAIKKSPFRVLLYTKGKKTIQYGGVTLTQEMYTPINTDSQDQQPQDRPYAGTLFATQFADIRYPEKKLEY